MTSEELGEMFEGDSADMCAGKIPLVSMGGRAEGLACTDSEATTPIGARGNFHKVSFYAESKPKHVKRDKCYSHFQILIV